MLLGAFDSVSLVLLTEARKFLPHRFRYCWSWRLLSGGARKDNMRISLSRMHSDSEDAVRPTGVPSSAAWTRHRGTLAFLMSYMPLSQSVLATTSAVEEASSRELSLPSDQAIAHAIDMRQSQGLRSDDAYVRSTFTMTGTSSSSLGVPVTADEDSLLAQQVALSVTIETIIPSFTDEPGFGGAWYDLSTDQIIVAVTRDAAKDLVHRVAESINSNKPIVIRNVAVSLATLKDAYGSANKLAASNPEGDLRRVSLDVRGNAVTLGVRPNTTASARAGIAVTVGASTRIVDHVEGQDQNTIWDQYAPVRGGKQIVRDDLIFCSAGTSGTGSDGYYIITAGHCGPRGTHWRYGGGSPIGSLPATELGTTVNNPFYELIIGGYHQTDCDCSVIGPLPSWGPWSASYFLNSPNYAFFYATAHEADIYLVRPVCHVGAGGNNQCGYITDPHLNEWVFDSGVGWVYRSEFVQSSADGCGGDSGGPHYSMNMFMGIHSYGTGDSAGGNCRTLTAFSRASTIANRTGVGPVSGS